MSEPAAASLLLEQESSDLTGEFPLDLANYALHLVVVIGRQRELDLERLLQAHGSSFVRHRALSVIRRVQPCTMRDLAEFGSADRTTMTRTVDQLVAAGLVVRTTPPNDRRQVQLSLTQAGVATHTESMKLANGLMEGVIEGIDEEALRAAVRTYERIAANVIGDPARARRLLLREGERG